MGKRYVIPEEDGGVTIILLAGDAEPEFELTKTLFELSKISDSDDVFDPDFHTLDNIASGLNGHRALTYHEIEEDELPKDRYFRNAWEWVD